MKSESDIEQEHRKIAKAAGWLVVKIMRASPNGFPDRLYAKNGRVVLMEWKRPGGPVSPQQRLRHRELHKAKVEVYVVESLIEANWILGINGPRVCLCGCGRQFVGPPDKRFAFEVCRIKWEQAQEL